MTALTRTVLFGTILVAGVAFAKEGVQDPVVKARMDLMGIFGANSKVLGEMAAGKTAFDAAAAATAKANIAAAAAQIPAAFEVQATDPVSDSKPEIWTNWDDYVAKSEALLSQAEALDTSTLEGIQAGMGSIGGTCKACHTAYRM